MPGTGVMSGKGCLRFLCGITIALLGLVASDANAAGKVWVVDDAPGTGVDFTSIQAAVNAASEGDTVLVRDGTYPSFVVNGISLVIQAEEGASVTVYMTVLIENLAVHQFLVMRGIEVTTTAPFQPGFFPLILLRNNVGHVWMEEVSNPAPSFLSQGGYTDVVEVQQCDRVSFVRCSLHASAQFSTGLSGSSGVDATDSTIFLYDSYLEGGSGGAGGLGFGGGAGGSALTISSASGVAHAFISGSSCVGGTGGSGGVLFSHGAGGHGIEATGASTTVQYMDSSLFGGNAGGGGAPTSATKEVSGATINVLSGNARSLLASSPVRGGQTATLDYAGQPGDSVFLLVSFVTDALYMPPYSGGLFVASPVTVIPLGSAPSSGGIHMAVPLPPFPASVDTFTAYLQVASFSAAEGYVLGSHSAMTGLHQKY